MVKKSIFMAVVAVSSVSAFADNSDEEPTAHLGQLAVVATQANPTSLLGKSQNISNQVIGAQALKQNSATLGDAIKGELGIHSNHYGGGASAPIIRGQEGKRIKVLQNSADVVDMSAMSPDHAITVDTILAKRVEIVRGVDTLLFSSGNAAGVINVMDGKIPVSWPENIKGDVGLRYNTNSHEKITNVGLTTALGSNVALHIEGLNRQADDYKTPDYQHGTYASVDDFQKRKKTYQSQEHLPDSWANSQTGSVGLSWIGDQGYLGASYTTRQDRYGMPAHNHIYDGCYVRVVPQGVSAGNPYLYVYPELAQSHQVNWANPGVIMADCHKHSEEDINASPYVDLSSKRYDVRGQLNQPLTGIDKVRVSAAYVDYQHNETEGDEVANLFKNKGINARLDVVHQPIGNLTGLWGIQYLQQKNSALRPAEDSLSAVHKHRNDQQLLNNNTMKNISLFGLERYQFKNVLLEVSARLERQKVSKDFDHKKVREEFVKLGRIDSKRPETANAMNGYYALTKPHKDKAYSVAGSVHWQFLPNHQLSLTASRQERLPNAQELYAHGMHLATNSFEMGNKDLKKEKSNNFELSLSHQGEKLEYKLSAYRYNFANYIYLYTMNADPSISNRIKDDSDLKVNRYMQAPAYFKGFEGNIGYQLTPKYHVSFFGDWVNGRLKSHDIHVENKKSYVPNPAYLEKEQELKAEGKIKPFRIRNYIKNELKIEPELEVSEPIYKKQAEMYVPRLPPMRLGTRIKADFNDNWSGDVEYYRVFAQNKLSKFEKPSPKHDMLNLTINYNNLYQNSDYQIFFKANNLLNQKVYAHETFLPYIPQMGRNFSLGVNVKF